ncbi:MAG: CoA-binding protein [Herminiimonas sp.]|nr:CoA-binding protein [Herminiimonas sp.]
MATDLISTILAQSRTIAVVGLSEKPERPSHGVARYLQAQGYRIVPVNPACAGTMVLGEPCYANLIEASTALTDAGQPNIDVVDCFRRADAIAPVMDDAIRIGARYVWMQIGVVNEPAAEQARAAGLGVVMDRCIKIEHAAWLAESRTEIKTQGAS